ncbi:MAG: ATP-binding protein, partial [Thermodesulfobacteriota bacterium]
ETVLDDGLQDRENSVRFLEIVLKKANHLNAIIDHLLLLSRIEQQDDAEQIELELDQVKPVLAEAIHCCIPQAKEKQIDLQLDCPDNLTMKMHTALLEQAVVNLIVNAVRYSHRESEILVRAKKQRAEEQDQVIIQVQDFGVGIGAEHLPRLFERFYRSDKARSRKLGGTGLGLAIVKHIAQAHKGDVEVQSEAGKGTTVFINLPTR